MKLPIIYQRAEGLAILIAASFLYFFSGLDWLFYIVFLLAFDVFMIGYLVNSKIGAIAYNIGHSFIIPSLLIVVVMIFKNDILLGITCLWFAHIGLDRALGYGLKTAQGFRHTHLGDIGTTRK